jgi:hypothetical protein
MILKILLIILAIPVGLVILAIIVFMAYRFVISPILDKIEEPKFTKLDQQSQVIFDKLKAAAGTDDNWVYKKTCQEYYSGDWALGYYYCNVDMFLRKTVSSAAEIKALQEKYYPIVDSSPNLKQKADLLVEYPDTFGKEFVISGVDKEYTNTNIDSGLECKYLVWVSQTESNSNYDSDSFSHPIVGGVGGVWVDFKCGGDARKSWYELTRY